MRKIKRWFKRNYLVLIVVIIFAFPLIVGLVYALPLPQYIAVESGDFLTYYAAAFGILGSFLIWLQERKKEKAERKRELTPMFAVQVCKDEDCGNLFHISIQNHTEQPLRYLYLYDEYLADFAEKQYDVPVVYNQTKARRQEANARFNISVDPDIVDKTGFPTYVQLVCEDIEENTWNCCYYKIDNCGQYYYYPRGFEIL